MEKKLCLHSHVKAFVKTCYLNCKIKTMSILINYSKNICRDIWTLFKVKNLAFLAAGISVSKSVTLSKHTPLSWSISPLLVIFYSNFTEVSAALYLSYIQRICQQWCSLSSTGVSIFIFMPAVSLTYWTCFFNFHPLHNTPEKL